MICRVVCIHCHLPKGRKKAWRNCTDWNVAVIFDLICQPKRLRQHVSPKCRHPPTKTSRRKNSEQHSLNNLRRDSMWTLLPTASCLSRFCIETVKTTYYIGSPYFLLHPAGCTLLPHLSSKKYWRIYYSARLNFPRDCKIMFRGWSYGWTNTPIKSLKSINFLQSLGTGASCRSS